MEEKYNEDILEKCLPKKNLSEQEKLGGLITA